MRRYLVLALAISALLVAAGCGSDSESEAESEPSEAAAATTAAPDEEPAADDAAAGSEARKKRRRGTTVKLGRSQFGRVLFDRAGQAIYLFDKERSARSRCYGACAEAWPPVLTRGRPRAARGLDKDLLGTTKRRDGKTQVTYNGHPLYYYAHEGRNEVRCHNVPGFGGLWLALDAEGDAAPTS